MPVLGNIVSFFRTGPDRPPFTSDPVLIDRVYQRRRWSVILSVMIGYGMFYVCRVNISFAKVPMIAEDVLSASEMGLIGSSMLLAYAIGKMFNGVLADRANIRRFMATALLASALVNLVLGWTSAFVPFALLWGLNGWFQSIGSAPSVVAISQWFSRRERGTAYGFWSISHNLGEGITFIATSALVVAFGWEWGFWGPGLLCALAAVILFRTLADRPETYGLPPVHVHRNDTEPTRDRQSAVGRQQWEVLENPAVWLLGLASASLYVTRYGIDNWGALYLVEAKNHPLDDAGWVLSACPVMGFIGSASAGMISDLVFKSRRSFQAFLLGLVQIGALVGLRLAPPDSPGLDALALLAYGYATGGLMVFVGGLMAVDVVPQRAVGTAMGLVGMFSYIGASVQDAWSGYLIQESEVIVGGVAVRDYDGAMDLWIGASILSVVLALGVWVIGKVRANRISRSATPSRVSS